MANKTMRAPAVLMSFHESAPCDLSQWLYTTDASERDEHEMSRSSAGHLCPAITFSSGLLTAANAYSLAVPSFSERYSDITQPSGMLM